MSWFSSSKPVPATEPSLDEAGNYKPLKREERRLCWEARDAYFTCLDKNKILDALKDEATAKRQCQNEDQIFERDCASSWVKYFKQKRVADFERAERTRKLEAEGALPLSEAEKPKWKLW